MIKDTNVALDTMPEVCTCWHEVLQLATYWRRCVQTEDKRVQWLQATTYISKKLTALTDIKTCFKRKPYRTSKTKGNIIFQLLIYVYTVFYFC
jgi:hypothetical protein